MKGIFCNQHNFSSIFIKIPLSRFSTISVLAIQHIKEKNMMDLQERDSSPVQLLVRGHCRSRNMGSWETRLGEAQ